MTSRILFLAGEVRGSMSINLSAEILPFEETYFFKAGFTILVHSASPSGDMLPSTHFKIPRSAGTDFLFGPKIQSLHFSYCWIQWVGLTEVAVVGYAHVMNFSSQLTLLKAPRKGMGKATATARRAYSFLNCWSFHCSSFIRLLGNSQKRAHEGNGPGQDLHFGSFCGDLYRVDRGFIVNTAPVWYPQGTTPDWIIFIPKGLLFFPYQKTGIYGIV